MVRQSRMAEWLRRLPLDHKIQGSIPGSNLLWSCHGGAFNIHIPAHEVYFHCLPSCLLNETLNQGTKLIASVVPACKTKHSPFMD